MVCDMAGTTVEEGGMVYETLQEVMNAHGLNVTEEAMHPWHGAKKEAVIEHFALLANTPQDQINAKIEQLSAEFVASVQTKYFGTNSGISFIRPNLADHLNELRTGGMRIGLDTGYPPEIQQALVEALNFEPLVDGYISSYQVAEGRPYPYMIHALMERLGVADVRRVCKVGDSVRDVQMGRNAGCGLVVGVLSGADSADALLEAGADVIAGSIVDLPVPLPLGAEMDVAFNE